MKKLISCLLAVLLVCSLMSMNVFAATTTTTPGTTNAVGTRPEENGDFNDGVTDFEDTDIKADVGVSFGETTTTDPETGESVTTGKNVLEHRYAIDIVYKALIFDLSDLNQQTVTTQDPNAAQEKEYRFVWDVTNHTYVMVEVIDGELQETPVDPEDPAFTDTAIEITDAFQVINHSDLPVEYSAGIEVSSQYESVLNLGIASAGETTLGTQTINACQATATTENGVTTWTPATQQEGDAYTIYATPDNNWAETIGALVVAGQLATQNVTIGSLTITVTKSN